MPIIILIFFVFCFILIPYKIFCTYIYLFSINTRNFNNINTADIWKEHTILVIKKDKESMVLDQRWKLKVEEKHLQEEEKKEEKHLLFSLMKSKIICLSKNDEFKEILKGRKNSNKYFTIFFKKLTNKNNKKLNISFIAKKN